MKYYIQLQGSCWLIQYLNYTQNKYSKIKFYQMLAINRFLRYNKIIELIKNTKILKRKKYILNFLMSFEGSIFDIDDILCYKVKGKINCNTSLDKILLINEKVNILLLEMIDSKIDNSNKIFDLFKEVFGDIKIIKDDNKTNLNILMQDNRYLNDIYITKNSQYLYDRDKIIINNNNIIDYIITKISEGHHVLVCLDIGKGILENQYLSLPNISSEMLSKYLVTDNHYYIITDMKKIKGKLYFYAFSGYDDNNEFILIEKKYLELFIDHVLYDKIILDTQGVKKIDIFKLMESE